MLQFEYKSNALIFKESGFEIAEFFEKQEQIACATNFEIPKINKAQLLLLTNII